jgi:hypothetical protein
VQHALTLAQRAHSFVAVMFLTSTLQEHQRFPAMMPVTGCRRPRSKSSRRRVPGYVARLGGMIRRAAEGVATIGEVERAERALIETLDAPSRSMV